MDVWVKRWTTYGGLLFVVLVAAAVFVSPSPPSNNATAAKVVASYHAHQNGYFVNAYIIVAAVVVGLTYFWYLREYLAQVETSRRLLTVAYAGGIVFAVSGLVGAGVKFALADGSHDAHLAPSAMQALNVLGNDLNVPLTAAGVATFLVLTGIVVVRDRALPRWLGWVAIVFGILSLPGIAGPVGAGLWILIASIVLLVRGGSAEPTSAPLPSEQLPLTPQPQGK